MDDPLPALIPALIPALLPAPLPAPLPALPPAPFPMYNLLCLKMIQTNSDNNSQLKWEPLCEGISIATGLIVKKNVLRTTQIAISPIA